MASVPSIRIDLSSGGQGTTGQSRTDATNGETVTLVDTANASGDYTWTLVVPDGSSSTLSSATAASPTFTIDVAHGTYLVYVEVDGVRSYSEDATGAKVSTQGGCAVLENGFRKPVAGETTQFDSDEGWSKTLDDFLDDFTGLYNPTQGEIAYADSNGEWAALAPGSSGEVLTSGGTGANPSWSSAGAGDVTAAANIADNALVRGNGGAKGIQQSGITVDDSDNLSGIGNITLTGTVDGRDVATDGTKLDGIESAADVTDATNVDAAGAVMESHITGSTGVLRRTGTSTYDAADEIASGIGTPVNTEADAATITFDCSASNVHKTTLGGNRTLAFSNPREGQTIQVFLIQDGTGSRTVTWPAAFKWPGGTAPTLTTTASAVDIVSATYDGTSWYAVSQLDFQ